MIFEVTPNSNHSMIWIYDNDGYTACRSAVRNELSCKLKFRPEGWLDVFSVSKFHYFLQDNASQSILSLK